MRPLKRIRIFPDPFLFLSSKRRPAAEGPLLSRADTARALVSSGRTDLHPRPLFSADPSAFLPVLRPETGRKRQDIFFFDKNVRSFHKM
ncbi:hypothetical protein B4135_4292 [Caldibacillus debilis]|uniref:Uncharacterized protein n=1 Tax=Caldibacillus debilis TaxID=301148 RepID=A0A150L5M9_9BACI|nr:hypothetical protein B4135_4292 [Caldibacillus debilis]